MDFSKILSELHNELDRTEEAIVALERLVASKEKRRGRPPKWLQAVRQTQHAGSSNGNAAGDIAERGNSARAKSL